MTVVLQVGDRCLTGEEVVSLLAGHQLLPQLLRELVIYQAIAPFPCTFDETLQACKAFYEKHQISSEVARLAWVQQQGITLEQMEARATRSLRLEKFKQATWGSKLEPYFLERKASLDRVIYSLIRVQRPEIAQELYFRLQAGEQSFTELAQEYSEGAEAQTGGLIGPVEMAVPHPALAKLLAQSQPGQLSPPVRLGEWYVIVRLEKYFPAQLDSPTRQRLLNELFESWLTRTLQEQPVRLLSSDSEPLTSPETPILLVPEPALSPATSSR